MRAIGVINVYAGNAEPPSAEDSGDADSEFRAEGVRLAGRHAATAGGADPANDPVILPAQGRRGLAAVTKDGR